MAATTGSEDLQYWAVIAQTLPVVALALVVEIRSLGATWPDVPVWVRRCYSAIWAITLLILAFGETVALSALRGEQVADRWPSLVNTAVSFAISALVIGPALLFVVRSNADVFAKLVSQTPRLRFRTWRHRRRAEAFMRRVQRDANEQVAELNALLSSAQSVRSHTEALVALAEVSYEDAAPVIRRADETIVRLKAARSQWSAKGEEWIDTLQRDVTEAANLEASLKDLNRRRRTLAESVLASVDSPLSAPSTDSLDRLAEQLAQRGAVAKASRAEH